MILVLISSCLLKYPVLKMLGVNQPDLIEALSIPSQQIARTITEHNDLSEDQYALLSHVVDLEKVKEKYRPGSFDPVKNLIRSTGDQTYIKEHAGEFLRLYISLGLRHPFSYAKGWIDQTKGYWNSGYAHWRWCDAVKSNHLGIHRTIRSETLNRLLDTYCAQFAELPILSIFLCVGFFDWLLLFILFISLIRRDKTGVMLTIPAIMNILSLLISTPVFCEFRYDYATFCILPAAAFLALRPRDTHEMMAVSH